MDILKLDIKLIDGGMIPEYKTEGSVGADCFARLDKPFDLYPNTRAKIPLGFAVSLPAGFEMQIRGRSGLADKKGSCLLSWYNRYGLYWRSLCNSFQ